MKTGRRHEIIVRQTKSAFLLLELTVPGTVITVMLQQVVSSALDCCNLKLFPLHLCLELLITSPCTQFIDTLMHMKTDIYNVHSVEHKA